MPRRPPNRVRFPRNNRHHFYSCVYCNNRILNVPRNNGNAVALLLCRIYDVVLDEYVENLLLLFSATKGGGLEHGDVVMCDARQTVSVRFNSRPNRRFHNRLPVVNVNCNGQIGERVTLPGRINYEPVLLFRSDLFPLQLLNEPVLQKKGILNENDGCRNSLLYTVYTEND
ncbi:hypothetical protein V6N13_034304 [Hibiscus sabdariffa]|uniref:Uncharacterized protein n=1 Tax=Hibiscus sabdariffa TaxID=183260 RepID=A0ABR2F7W4_9ROSI